MANPAWLTIGRKNHPANVFWVGKIQGYENIFPEAAAAFFKSVAKTAKPKRPGHFVGQDNPEFCFVKDQPAPSRAGLLRTASCFVSIPPGFRLVCPLGMGLENPADILTFFGKIVFWFFIGIKELNPGSGVCYGECRRKNSQKAFFARRPVGPANGARVEGREKRSN